MILLRDSSLIPPHCHGAVLALGNFDGLHVGHHAVIDKAIALARASDKPAAVMTFEPHPRQVFRPDLPVLRILPLKDKIRLLEAMGIDYLRIIRFTPEFAQTTASVFVEHILHEQLQVSHVVTGEDFVFGHERSGNAASLKTIAEKLGFGATACAPIEVEGARCSSTRIRAALGTGDVGLVARLLGRPYVIAGHVREGDKRGRGLGFPTANLFPPPVFLPAFGVYAVRVNVQGKHMMGVANLGLRPTFGGSRVRLETHLFDWQGDIYGKSIEVEFMHYIRAERKFDGLEALKDQITQDSAQAHMFFATVISADA